MRYIYLLITIVLCFSCNKENQITNGEEKLNIQEREISVVEGDFMSISFASSSESYANSGNKVISSTDGRIYGDLPDEVIGLCVEILDSSDEVIAEADFTRTVKSANQDSNNHIFLPKPKGKSSKGINIVDGKIRIDKTKFNNKDIYAQIFGFQNHLLDKNKYKNIVVIEQDEEKKYSNLIWYGKSELKEKESSLKMSMLNGELHLVFPTLCIHPALCDKIKSHCTDENHDHSTINRILSHIKDDEWAIICNINILYSVRDLNYKFDILDRGTQDIWNHNIYFDSYYYERKYELTIANHYTQLVEVDENNYAISDVIEKGNYWINAKDYIKNDGNCHISIKNTEQCIVLVDLNIYNEVKDKYLPVIKAIDKKRIYSKDGINRTFTIHTETYLPKHKKTKYSYKYRRRNNKWNRNRKIGSYWVEARQRVSSQYSSRKENTKANPLGISIEEIKLN